jgi:hypothetical protein
LIVPESAVFSLVVMMVVVVGAMMVDWMRWLCDGIISFSVVFMVSIFYFSEIVWKLQQHMFLYWQQGMLLVCERSFLPLPFNEYLSFSQQLMILFQ